MTGATIALGVLCAVSWLLLAGCYQGVRVLRARAEAAERREAKANGDRISAEARADALGRRVGEWSRVAGEREAHITVLLAQAADLLDDRDRLRVEVADAAGRLLAAERAAADHAAEVARLTAALAEGDRRWIGAIRSERAKAHPSGAVVRALDAVTRSVRGDCA